MNGPLIAHNAIQLGLNPPGAELEIRFHKHIQPIWRSLYAGRFVAVREKPRQTLGVSSGQFTSWTANSTEAFREDQAFTGWGI